MSEQYDECSDSARFKRPRWAAEWCTWLARWWRSGARKIHNSRPIAALNIHGTVVWLLQMCASPRESSFSTNPCSPANPSPNEVGRPRYLDAVDLSPARARPVIAARVGLRSADCLVDCSRKGESACPCRWPQSRGHSSYTRRFFVEGLTAAFEPASCSFLPISRISTRQRHCRLVKPGRPRRPHLMKSPEIVTLATSSLAIADVADQ